MGSLRLDSRGGSGVLLRGGLLLVKLTDSEGGKGLHEAGSVVGSGGISKGKHGLGELAVELGGGVGELGLDVDKLLDVVEGSVHLEHLAGGSLVLLGVIRKLHARLGAGKLGFGGGPLNGGSLVKEVGGIEVGDSLLLDLTNTEGLLVLLVEVCGEDLNDEVGVLGLGGNVLVEVGLAGLDGSHDGLEAVAALLHVTLDLPVQLDLVGDVKVKGEVEEVTDALVVHGVETLEDDDGGGLDGLGSIESSVDVVVDGLLDSLAVLEGADLLEHEVEVVLALIESGETGLLAAVAVVEMVVIEADDGGEVTNEGVGLPSSVSEATAERADDITAKGGGEATHEGGLSASGVSSDSNDDGGLTVLEGHVEGRGGLDLGGRAAHEGGGGEGGGRAGEGGSDSELHV